jgi:hypothetical protein
MYRAATSCRRQALVWCAMGWARTAQGQTGEIVLAGRNASQTGVYARILHFFSTL